LDFDERRIVMAYMFLASMAGSPAIIYGDELGKGNDKEFMKQQTQEKRKKTGNMRLVDDGRDMNRGWIGDEELSSERARVVSEGIARVWRVRQELGIATSKSKRIVMKNERVFAVEYETKKGKLLVFVNLGNEEVVVKKGGEGKVVVAINGAGIKNDVVMLPGYGGVWVEGKSSEGSGKSK